MSSENGLYFNVAIEGLADDAFVVTEFAGEEALSTLFNYRIKLASRQSNFTAQQTVDRNATLTIWQQGEAKRHINGVVRRFAQSNTGHHHSFYELELVPALARLQLRHNCRIFQQQSTVDIIGVILGEMGIDDYAFAVTGSPQTREYCVQYSETDLAFVERLAAEEGIFYSFTHTADSHTVVFSDSAKQLAKLPKPLTYNTMPGGIAETPFIRHWAFNSQVEPSSVQLKDYSFKNPAYGFVADAAGTEMDYQHGTYEHYDYPGRYKADTAGKSFASARLEYLRRDALTAHANSNIAMVAAGCRFDLTDHSDSAMNRDWTVIRCASRGTQPQALEEHGGDGETTFNNEFSSIPGHRPWRPTPITKPMVHGPQIAKVTGPSGEEIFCDEFGRVKVQFPWDRDGKNDDNSSCWVRVSQGWAGAGYGLFALPRIGHEVIVSFLEGDPDQPIITGRTFHATNLSPYDLPANKTRTVLKTQSHQSEGANELRFEDAGGQEEIYVHAQKDQNIVVENNETAHIKVDRTHKVDNNDSLTVGNNQTISIGNNQDISVDNNRSENVTKDESVSIGGNRSHSVTKDESLMVDGKATEIVKKDKSLTVDSNYSVSVAKNKNETVDKDSIEKIAKKRLFDVGETFAIVCGSSKLTMKKDGTIILEGKKIKIDGETQVQMDSKKVKIEGSSAVQVKGKKVGMN